MYGNRHSRNSSPDSRQSPSIRINVHSRSERPGSRLKKMVVLGLREKREKKREKRERLTQPYLRGRLDLMRLGETFWLDVPRKRYAFVLWLRS